MFGFMIRSATSAANIIVCASIALMLATPASAVSNIGDRLEDPAPDTAQPERSLLIDITRLDQRLVAVGARGLIVYSDDNGKQWHQAQVPVSVALVALHFVDAQAGWAVGHSGVVLHTKDGGETWQRQFDGEQANALVVKQAEAELASMKQRFETASADELDDLRYAIEDAEFALEDARADVKMGAGKPLLDVWFRNRQEGFVIGAYGFFFATSDGGKTWQNAAPRLENFDRYHLNAISQLEGGSIIIAGEAGQMFASYDDGASWETLYSPYHGSWFGLQPTGEEGGVLAYGLRGHVYRSEDAGQSWQEVAVPTEATLANSMRAPNSNALVLVGQSGTILQSADQGRNFFKKETTFLEDYTAVAPGKNQELILVGEKGVRIARQ